jgi:hypothetical protein
MKPNKSPIKILRHEINPEQLEQYAWQYITDCINHKRAHPTASGRVVMIADRQIPTISYFLKIWMPTKGLPGLSRSTYYNWLNSTDNAVMDTIKNIEGMFTALATDIVANEGKGIFYAKNKLGMSDKPEIEIKTETNFKVLEIVAQKINSNADKDHNTNI